MPAGQAGMASGVINGKLYLAGGTDNTGSPTGQLQVYTPGTNSWAIKAPMPSRNFPAGSEANGLFYVLGGQDSNDDKSRKVEAYTP